MIEKTYGYDEEIVELLQYLQACSTKKFEGMSIINAWNNTQYPSDLMWFLCHLSNISGYPKRIDILEFFISEFNFLEFFISEFNVCNSSKIEDEVDDCIELLVKIRDTSVINEFPITIDTTRSESHDVLNDIVNILLYYEGELYLSPSVAYELISSIKRLSWVYANIYLSDAQIIKRIRSKFQIPSKFDVKIDEELIDIMQSSSMYNYCVFEYEEE